MPEEVEDIQKKAMKSSSPTTLIRNLDYSAMLKAEQFGSF